MRVAPMERALQSVVSGFQLEPIPWPCVAGMVDPGLGHGSGDRLAVPFQILCV
jgi:hypothetical protein